MKLNSSGHSPQSLPGSQAASPPPPNGKAISATLRDRRRAAQVIDPNAPTRNTGLGTTDGKAVAGAQKAYADSYGYAVKEPKPPELSISTTGRK